MSEKSSKSPKVQIILASASPRRKKLLEDAGIKFSVRISRERIDESLPQDALTMPAEAAKKLAERKAGAVVQEILAEAQDEAPNGTFAIIGADTMVVKDGKIYGKPRNLENARDMLHELSGATHEVITAVSVWVIEAASGKDISLGYKTFADLSRVTFRELSDEEILAYLKCGESFDKAGAYAIQGKGADLVEKVEGSLDTVIGLPVQRLKHDFPDLFD